MIKLTLPGPIPSKKNSRNIFQMQGRTFNLPGKVYKKWHAMARNYAITERRAEPMNVKGVQIEFYFLDKRGRDLTNMAESIMDLLVDCQILVDDKWQCTGPVHLIPCGIDKINPRAEVTLFMM